MQQDGNSMIEPVSLIFFVVEMGIMIAILFLPGKASYLWPIALAICACYSLYLSIRGLRKASRLQEKKVWYMQPRIFISAALFLAVPWNLFHSGILHVPNIQNTIESSIAIVGISLLIISGALFVYRLVHR